jgi:hypothetical protein
MKHILGTLFAIGVAGVAAIAATTAFLNSPLNIGPASNTPTAATPSGQTEPPAGAEDKTATPQGGAQPAPPGGSPDATPRGAGAPDTAAKPAAEGQKPDEDDKDPYEGIAPEELPPDLQYDADSSVSFPTNI